MGQVAVVIGQAGTGKTTWLMSRACEIAPRLIATEHQRMLVITRMHGARRRLEQKLKGSCQNIPYSVSTIDGFALSVANRWRTAIGHSRPLVAVPGDVDFVDGVLGVEADFGRVVGSAAALLESRTVGGVIAATYPLVVIDEFQDCHGPLLEFVAALSKHSSVLLAADDFQLLDSTVTGCPAVGWAEAQAADGAVTIERLTICHRTSVTVVLEAARCLRENTASPAKTVPVVCCPRHPAAAWKIIDALVLGWYSPQWTGTCALISPSRDAFLRNVLDSCAAQLLKRNRGTIRWDEERSTEKWQADTDANLGITRDSQNAWQPPSAALDGVATHVVTRVQRYARLRGINVIPHRLVARHVDMAVHDQRACWSPSSSRTVTTVHGAKNREFTSVFVLWNPRSVSKWRPDEQRRLLYNAVTRSMQNCMVLVLGDESMARNDAVLSLLGPPEPAFPPKTKTRKRTARKAGSK